MEAREEILKQIRIMGRGTRGAPPAILELADDTLYEIFQQMQRGLSNRSIARYLLKCGMSGTENSLQQTLSLFRKRIAPLLAEESATPSLQTPVKLPAKFSSLPPDEMLSTLTDMIRFYGLAIRNETQAAAEKGTLLSESLIKHVKAYDILVARKARLEQNPIKDRPVAPTKESPKDLRRFEEIANTVHDYLTANNVCDHEMLRVSKRFLARLAQKCILVGTDPETGKLYKVTGPPSLNRTYNRERISD